MQLSVSPVLLLYILAASWLSGPASGSPFPGQQQELIPESYFVYSNLADEPSLRPSSETSKQSPSSHSSAPASASAASLPSSLQANQEQSSQKQQQQQQQEATYPLYSSSFRLNRLFPSSSYFFPPSLQLSPMSSFTSPTVASTSTNGKSWERVHRKGNMMDVNYINNNRRNAGIWNNSTSNGLDKEGVSSNQINGWHGEHEKRVSSKTQAKAGLAKKSAWKQRMNTSWNNNINNNHHQSSYPEVYEPTPSGQTNTLSQTHTLNQSPSSSPFLISSSVPLLVSSLKTDPSLLSDLIPARKTRESRKFDVPQVECPPSDDEMDNFACPSHDSQGRYRCIGSHALCDGFKDCPKGEDEDRKSCLFYKSTKAHLDVLADALLRWARQRY